MSVSRLQRSSCVLLLLRCCGPVPSSALSFPPAAAMTIHHCTAFNIHYSVSLTPEVTGGYSRRQLELYCRLWPGGWKNYRHEQKKGYQAPDSVEQTKERIRWETSFFYCSILSTGNKGDFIDGAMSWFRKGRSVIFLTTVITSPTVQFRWILNLWYFGKRFILIKSFFSSHTQLGWGWQRQYSYSPRIQWALTFT